MRWRSTLLLALVLAGCNSGPRLVKVSGTVTHGGEAVPFVTLYFEPDEGRASTAMTDAQGRFTLSYTAKEEGAVAGHHKVHVEFRRHVPEQKDREAILAKYDLQHSSLQFTLDKDTPDLEVRLD
jgi:hypothetical protein